MWHGLLGSGQRNDELGRQQGGLLAKLRIGRKDALNLAAAVAVVGIGNAADGVAVLGADLIGFHVFLGFRWPKSTHNQCAVGLLYRRWRRALRGGGRLRSAAWPQSDWPSYPWRQNQHTARTGWPWCSGTQRGGSG